MRKSSFFYLSLCFLFSLSLISETKINSVQVLATHNSFKQYLDSNLTSIIESFCNLIDIQLDNYQHLPLKEQLDKGVRGVELDVFADPKGGRFREFRLLSYIGEDGLSYNPDLDKPGFKVMHDVNLDFRSSCYLFTGCLKELLQWSHAHPNHLPIFVHIQVRDESTPVVGALLEKIGLAKVLPMTASLMDDLDLEIKNIIPAHQIITPDEVRGNYATLRAAVLANAWPMVSDARGRFIFYMDATPRVQEIYLQGHPQLGGRIIFTVPESSDRDDAAFMIVNDPIVDREKIAKLVSMGFIVRTRADSGTVEAYENDKTRWQAALLSGAQLVSTDFIVPDPRTGTDYYVFMPDGHPGRCSPVRQSFCNENDISE